MRASDSFFHPLVGHLVIEAEAGLLRAIRFVSSAQATHSPEAEKDLLAEARDQLLAYCQRRLRRFELPYATGLTDFQNRVLNVVAEIPFGQTRSYGAIAEQVGSPGAYRAVGAANARNPLPLVVPCHRVIGSTGKLTGFSAGLGSKRSLLEHEQRVLVTAGDPLLEADRSAQRIAEMAGCGIGEGAGQAAKHNGRQPAASQSLLNL